MTDLGDLILLVGAWALVLGGGWWLGGGGNAMKAIPWKINAAWIAWWQF